MASLSERSRLSDATWTAFTEAIRFVVVPVVLVSLVTTHYPDLTTVFMPEIETYILFFGGMIVGASTLEAINRPGTYKRMLFGLAALAFVCLWLFVIFGGGIAQMKYQAFTVKFDMSKIVYIMLFGISLKGLLVISTFSSNRSKITDEVRRDEQDNALAATAVRRSPPRKRKPAQPSFSNMSRVAFQVTPDDAIGFSPPPPSPMRPARRTLAYKECPICGARAEHSETTCKNCGAWFPKESIR